MFVISRNIQKQSYLLGHQLKSSTVIKTQQRPLSIWKIIPKVVLATVNKKHRKYVIGALGAASLASSVMGPVVWVAAGSAASIFSWRLFRKTKNWWDYLTPVIGKDSTVSQALLSQIGTHRAADLVRSDTIKQLKHFFESTEQGKNMLLAFGLDHFKDLVWDEVHRSETTRLDDKDKHKVNINFWLEDQVSKGPRGGGCEVIASATVSGKGKIELDEVKLSAPGWHKDEVIPLT